MEADGAAFEAALWAKPRDTPTTSVSAVRTTRNRRGFMAFPFSLAAGPHPRRELTLTPRRGFSRPRRRVAAGDFHCRPGPPPAAERHLHRRAGSPVLGAASPRALFKSPGAPPPPRTTPNPPPRLCRPAR